MLNAKFNSKTCNTDTQNRNCNKISSAFIWLLNAIRKKKKIIGKKESNPVKGIKYISLPFQEQAGNSSQQIRAAHLSAGLCLLQQLRRGQCCPPHLSPTSPKNQKKAPKIPLHSKAQPCRWLILPLICFFFFKQSHWVRDEFGEDALRFVGKEAPG